MPKFLSSVLVLLLMPCMVFSSPEKTKSDTSLEQEEISTNEDLMREHGILNRLLLVYQEIASRIEKNQEFPIESLTAKKITNM